MRRLGCLIAALAAASAAACQSATGANTPPGPSYKWSVTNEMLGELQITAIRERSPETVTYGVYPDIRQETRERMAYTVTVRGIWPERNVRTGETLGTATVVRVYRYHVSRRRSWPIETRSGTWPPNQPFEFTTIIPTEAMEDIERGEVAICMGSTRSLECIPVRLMDTSDTNVPWLAAAQ